MVAVLVFTLIFALAACSDDGEGDTPTTVSATPTTTVSESMPDPTTPSESMPEPTSTPESMPEPTAPVSMAPAIRVVTTTNIVADWVENVGGDHVDVFSLVPTGADPHSFQPGAQDVAKIADADLVLSIGLGLEESWLHDLLENAARDEEAIVEMGEVVEPIEFGATHAGEVELLEEISHVVHEVEEGEIDPETGLEEIKELLAAMEEEEDEDHAGEEELPAMVMDFISQAEGGQLDAEEAIEEIEHLTSEGEDEHEGHGHGIHDPHFWFDPLRVKVVVDDIAERLSALDPERGDAYRANASAYGELLDDLHAWTGEQVAMVPEDRRLLVTSHESFGYFADLYGFKVVGVVLSITTEVEPSAEDLAELTQEAEEMGVPAVFGETTVSERLARAVATESGAKLVRLYSGSLGPEDGEAGTYLDMVRTNVERIVEALK